MGWNTILGLPWYGMHGGLLLLPPSILLHFISSLILTQGTLSTYIWCFTPQPLRTQNTTTVKASRSQRTLHPAASQQVMEKGEKTGRTVICHDSSDLIDYDVAELAS